MRTTVFLTTASALALGLLLTAETARAGDNELVIEQVANSNFAVGFQIGNKNETYIRQSGNSNTATTPLNSGGVNNNDVLVIQETGGNFAQYSGEAGTGGNNTIAVRQYGGSFNTAAFAPQDSANNNVIGVVQNGSQNVVGGGGAGNEARGFGSSTVSFSQPALSGMETNDGALLDDADAAIGGFNNFVGLVQDGFQNVAGLQVTGNNNTIVGDNQSTVGAFAGPINLNATLGGSSFFDGNPEINGDARVASLSAKLGTEKGLAVQRGNNNQVGIVQTGNNNLLTFGQISSNNTAEFVQTGNNNFAQGTQN